MPEASDEIVLVTPVWKDAARLQAFGPELASALASSALPVCWVIADDGSELGERDRLMNLLADFSQVHPKVILHQADAHRGKGSIVREAWALVADAHWYAFVDADGSVSAGDLMGLLRAARDSGKSALGIRKSTASTKVAMSLWRRLAHRVYRCAARTWLGLRCEDPQCGAKMIFGNDYRRVCAELRESGFAFDTELLIRLANAGCAWREVPLSWIEKKGSKTRPFRDAWGMIAALWRLRRRA